VSEPAVQSVAPGEPGTRRENRFYHIGTRMHAQREEILFTLLAGQTASEAQGHLLRPLMGSASYPSKAD